MRLVDERNPKAAQMDQRRVIQKIEQFAQVVRQHLPVCDVLLYGSYVNGHPRRYSDIDVAVVVEEYTGDLFDMKARLFRLRRDIDVRIEPLLLERKHDPSNFLREIKRTGKLIASYS
jgi:uncharacterized protein